MDHNPVKHNFHFKNNNSFIYINNTPKLLRISKTPIMNLDKKKTNSKQYNNSNTNKKHSLNKKPYINLNLNLMQSKTMNNNKIRTITPNLRLREIVNKKFRENNYQNLRNFNNIKIKYKTELPEINTHNFDKSQNISFLQTEANYKKKDSIENMNRQLKLIFVMKNKINELNNKNSNIINNIETKIENKRMSKEKNNNNINKNDNNRSRYSKKDSNNYSTNYSNNFNNNYNNNSNNNISPFC
jgi:hypothetical protein